MRYYFDPYYTVIYINSLMELPRHSPRRSGDWTYAVSGLSTLRCHCPDGQLEIPLPVWSLSHDTGVIEKIPDGWCGYLVSFKEGVEPEPAMLENRARYGIFAVHTAIDWWIFSVHPMIYAMKNLVHMRDGKVNDIPMDLRGYLNLELPLTAVAVADRSKTIYGSEDWYVQKRTNFSAEDLGNPQEYKTPTLDELYDLTSSRPGYNLFVFPKQRLYERVISIVKTSGIRSRGAYDKIVGFYRDDGTPICPMISMKYSDLFSPPPIPSFLDKHYMEIIGGSLLLAYSAYMNYGVFPAPGLFSHMGSMSIVPSIQIANLLLNSVIYHYGESIVGDIVGILARKMRSSYIGDPYRLARTVNEIGLSRRSVPVAKTKIVVIDQPIFNLGKFLWSSTFLPVSSHTHFGGKSSARALIETLIGPGLGYTARANQAIRGILGD